MVPQGRAQAQKKGPHTELQPPTQTLKPAENPARATMAPQAALQRLQLLGRAYTADASISGSDVTE